ncbi:MAG: hypothetical protein IJT30_07725 [Muribaculaceae bacterium]|nr:hypothetical protein [Muribaculaceae bacterium]
MKKFLILGALATLLLGTTACNDDIVDVVSDGSEVPVQFVANLGDIDSRAISDGTKADRLTFYVFEDGEEISTLRQTVTVTGKQATISTKLVRGHQYSFVFWAQNSSCTAYAIGNTSIGWIMQVSYQNSPRGYVAPCNDENRDAFYKVISDYTVTGSFTEDVVLTRPLAQLNILASDAASVTDFENYTSSLSCNNLSNRMTLLDGVPGTNVSYRSFNAASLPTESLPGYEQYKLIATGYFLAPEERIVSKVNFTLSYDGHNIGENFDNVPIQRNYRTNIIGDFFTEGANYTIVIDPMYQNDADVWDGTTTETPVLDTETGAYTISSAAQLAGFAQEVNAGNSYAGKTVKLEANVDLDNQEWTPIGLNKYFEGTFDGQGHTVKNLKIATYRSYGNGFIYDLRGGASVRNLSIFGVDIVGGNVTGIVAGYAYGDVTFENVTVEAASIKGFGKVGGILGMAADPGGTTTMNNCSVTDSQIRGTYNVAGLVGFLQNKIAMSGCTVANIAWVLDDDASEYAKWTAADGHTVTSADGTQTRTLEGVFWKYYDSGDDATYWYAALATYCCDTDVNNAPYTFEDQQIAGLETGNLLAYGFCVGFVNYQF